MYYFAFCSLWLCTIGISFYWHSCLSFNRKTDLSKCKFPCFLSAKFISKLEGVDGVGGKKKKNLGGGGGFSLKLSISLRWSLLCLYLIFELLRAQISHHRQWSIKNKNFALRTGFIYKKNLICCATSHCSDITLFAIIFTLWLIFTRFGYFW